MKNIFKGRRLVVGLIVMAMAVTTVMPAFPVFAQGAPDGGIGGRTTKVDPKNPRTQSIFIHTINRGAKATDQVLVVNRSDRQRQIELKAVDGVATNTGAYACRENAEDVKGSGSWVKLDKTVVTLPARSEQKVDFTITVPENADVGEHNSCITFMDKNPNLKPEGGVMLRIRQAIRLSVTVPGKINRSIDVASFKQVDVPENGDKDAQYYEMQVKNSGSVSVDTDMRVRVMNLFGQKLADEGGEYAIIPGATLSQSFSTNLRPMFGGWYKAKPVIRYDKRIGVFGTKQESAEYEEKEGKGVMIFLWPTTLGWVIMALMTLALAAGVWWLLSRRKKRKSVNRYLVRYTVRDGDTLEGLAERSGFDWRDIAKLNDLKAPYALKAGQVLKVPIREEKVKAQQARARQRVEK